jgi:DNA-binding PadR family transcriptional regulator
MADVTLLVLVSLSDGPKHGYAIQKDVEASFGERLGPGTLYGAIDRLEGQGLIRPLEQRQRRQPYTLTDLGRVELDIRLDSLRRLMLRAARLNV